MRSAVVVLFVRSRPGALSAAPAPALALLVRARSLLFLRRWLALFVRFALSSARARSRVVSLRLSARAVCARLSYFAFVLARARASSYQ